jgi:Ca2+-binding EF-hand superfamily protein
MASCAPPAKAADPDMLLEYLNGRQSVEQFTMQVVGMLRGADRNDDGLDKEDIAIQRETMQAQRRASAIGQALTYDLNGDFKVTRAEVERAIRVDASYRSRAIDSQLSRYDTNGDGIITISEAAASATTPDQERYPLDQLLALDPNGDGKLTTNELRGLAQRVFASVDRNGDGEISREEYQPLGERVQQQREIRTAQACGLPPVPSNARLVVYGGYEGDTISSAFIGGPEEETNLIDVSIERGSDPLYLVLTSYESMVWRFSGATDRVARVVVSSLHSNEGRVSLSGVVGVPADHVTIATPGCPRYFHERTGRETERSLTALGQALGRQPNAVFASYSTQRISLPSGTLTAAQSGGAPVPNGFDPGMWREASRFWPGGLAKVDPRSIVAKARVAPYAVLPSQMGLSQLIGSGAIQPTGSGYRIVRPIPQMPPSMGGAHSVRLELANGVPMPPGDPVHSCVISLATGKPVRPMPSCGMND